MADDQAVSAPRLAIGIGCRAGATAANIISLVQRTLDEARLDSAGAKLFTIDPKGVDTALIKASRLFWIPIVFFSRAALVARAADAITRSDLVEVPYDVPSI